MGQPQQALRAKEKQPNQKQNKSDKERQRKPPGEKKKQLPPEDFLLGLEPRPSLFLSFSLCCYSLLVSRRERKRSLRKEKTRGEREKERERASLCVAALFFLSTSLSGFLQTWGCRAPCSRSRESAHLFPHSRTGREIEFARRRARGGGGGPRTEACPQGRGKGEERASLSLSLWFVEVEVEFFFSLATPLHTCTKKTASCFLRKSLLRSRSLLLSSFPVFSPHQHRPTWTLTR